MERRRTGGGGLVVVAIRILVSGSSCFLVIISGFGFGTGFGLGFGLTSGLLAGASLSVLLKFIFENTVQLTQDCTLRVCRFRDYLLRFAKQVIKLGI